jgi:SpoVK/Ycf46/Vps4 family AAA+-type ATPase
MSKHLGLFLRLFPQASASEVRPITIEDMRKSMKSVRPSVAQDQVKELERWNKEFGSY